MTGESMKVFMTCCGMDVAYGAHEYMKTNQSKRFTNAFDEYAHSLISVYPEKTDFEDEAAKYRTRCHSIRFSPHEARGSRL